MRDERRTACSSLVSLVQELSSSIPRTRSDLGWREACGRAKVLMMAGEFGYDYENQIS